MKLRVFRKFFDNCLFFTRRTGRRQARLALLSGYSRFVGLMKVALPATGFALLLVIFVWPYLAPRDKAFRLDVAQLDTKSVQTLSMPNPHYYGTDDKNQPFTVTAESGMQLPAGEKDDKIVALDKPVANVTRANGTNVVIKADTGYFNQNTYMLDLMGHVDLYQDNGYEVHTNSARVEVKPGNAAGRSEEHTSELQSHLNLVCRLLLEIGRASCRERV